MAYYTALPDNLTRWLWQYNNTPKMTALINELYGICRDLFPCTVGEIFELETVRGKELDMLAARYGVYRGTYEGGNLNRYDDIYHYDEDNVTYDNTTMYNKIDDTYFLKCLKLRLLSFQTAFALSIEFLYEQFQSIFPNLDFEIYPWANNKIMNVRIVVKGADEQEIPLFNNSFFIPPVGVSIIYNFI